MTKVTDRCYQATGRPGFICDYSPPRSGNPADLDLAPIAADFISVNCNPGRAVRANSALLAAWLRGRPGFREAGGEVIFTLATRDLNRLAAPSLLLGAQLHGLENLIALQGDPFTARDGAVTAASSYRPTALIRDARRMNEGYDFRGARLNSPTDFCIGAAVDLAHGIEIEARLAARKIAAGAHFLITQPVWNVDEAAQFRRRLAAHSPQSAAVPVFFGLQLLEPGGVRFGPVPPHILAAIESAQPPIETALNLHRQLQTAGLPDAYLIPPIQPGGARNYGAAREFLAAVR